MPIEPLESSGETSMQPEHFRFTTNIHPVTDDIIKSLRVFESAGIAEVLRKCITVYNVVLPREYDGCYIYAATENDPEEIVEEIVINRDTPDRVGKAGFNIPIDIIINKAMKDAMEMMQVTEAVDEEVLIYRMVGFYNKLLTAVFRGKEIYIGHDNAWQHLTFLEEEN